MGLTLLVARILIRSDEIIMNGDLHNGRLVGRAVHLYTYTMQGLELSRITMVYGVHTHQAYAHYRPRVWQG